MATIPLDGLTPEERAAWESQFGAQPTPVAAPNPDLEYAVADNSQPAWLQKARSVRVPTMVDAPPPEPVVARPVPAGGGPAGADWMAMAQGRALAEGARPKIEETRAPLNNDWAKYAKDRATQERANDAERAKNATYYNPDERYEQVDVDPRASQGGRMVKVSEGGRQPHSWSTQVQLGTQLPADVYEAYEKADKTQLAAIQKEQALAEQKAAYDAQYVDALDKYQRGYQANQAAIRQRQEAETSKAEGELRALQEHAAGDPTSNYFRDKGENSQLVFLIGAMLSGVGAGANGKNLAVEQLNRNVEHYIQNQKDTIKGKQNLLSELRTKFGDERMAEEAARIAYLERAKGQLARLMSDPAYDAAGVNAQKAQAAIEERIADRKMRFAAAATDKVAMAQQDVNAPAQYAQVGGAAGTGSLKEGFAKQLHSLSEDYEKAKVPQKQVALLNAERVIDIHGKDEVPGVGIGSSWVPDWAVGAEAAKNRQVLATMQNAVLHELSGAAVSDSEMKRLETGIKGARDAEGIRQFLRMQHEELSATQRNIARGHDPNVVRYYLQQGGPIRDIHPTKPLAPTVKRAE